MQFDYHNTLYKLALCIGQFIHEHMIFHSWNSLRTVFIGYK